MNKIKNIALAIVFIALIGIMGRLECQDEIKSVEYDKQNKAEVIKTWQVRCISGDVFDEQICKAVLNERK